MAKKKTVTQEPILPEKKVVLALKNMTPLKLCIKNKKLWSFGPNKGKWADYKNLHLTPGACDITEFLQGDTHQLMVYSGTARGTDRFFYMIRETDIEDGSTILLFQDHFEEQPGLACV